MVSWNEGEEGDNWVTYGSAFDEEDDRFRALQSGKHRNIPAAYEQRVLNEKGRPKRFHGAFTGGFSAGYFNTVGSKKGFQPCTFQSSRSLRQPDATEKVVQRPEDFMDEEDFGEFGIAPRRIKMSVAFDDTHVRDSLKAILGGQSVIPESGSIVKDLIVPSRGPLADRLLRKLGWRETGPILRDDGDNVHDENDKIGPENATEHSSPYTRISFDAKSDTFGLGYSGLNPDVAMGRCQSSSQQPDMLRRHPEESSTALAQRQNSLSFGFDPLGGASLRVGIRGQAFGVGALEVEDTDIYATDALRDYDWEIGDDASADEEEAELEAARSGRWSSAVREGRSSRGSNRTFDGWTAPTLSKSSTTKSDVLPGFIGSAKGHNQPNMSGPSNQSIRLPPGYMPVFNPECIRDPRATNSTQSVPNTHPLDPLSRSRMLEDSSDFASVFAHIDPVEKLRLDAAAAGLPVPSRDTLQTRTVDSAVATQTTAPPIATPALLKPFKTDPQKQARFEAFQVLLRRGFTAEIAYTRCSGAVDMPGDERERELNAFLAFMRTASKAQPVLGPKETTFVEQLPTDPSTPLFSTLPSHKQRLVSNLLSSRFRSAGCMDISKELSESEEKAFRAKVENLDTMDPRDHAVATECYGALTRRRLEWHPDRLLCKRINVPNPYPDSTFVGCPDERRSKNPFRRRRFGQRDGDHSGDFSLFDLLDVHVGRDSDHQNKCDDHPEDEPVSPPTPESPIQPTLDATASQSAYQHTEPLNSPPVYNPNPRGAALFACLFEAAEASTEKKITESSAASVQENIASNPNQTSIAPPPQTGPRVLGPTLPKDIESLTEEVSRPPMDLFKSIFASDEELSSSDTDAEGVTDASQNILPNDWMSVARESNADQSDADTSAKSLALLFHANSAADTPLFPLARITSQPVDRTQEKQLPTELMNPDPTSFYGPLPPPTTDSLAAEPQSMHPDSVRFPVVVSNENDEIQWTEAKDAKSEKRRKHGKHKHRSKRHKHSSKKSDKKERTHISVDSSSSSD